MINNIIDVLIIFVFVINSLSITTLYHQHHKKIRRLRSTESKTLLVTIKKGHQTDPGLNPRGRTGMD